MIKKRQTLEPELDPTEAQLNFIDDCFGEGSNIEQLLEEALQVNKREDTYSRLNANKKKGDLLIRRPDYKE